MTDKYEMTKAAARRIIAALINEEKYTFTYKEMLAAIEAEGFPRPRTKVVALAATLHAHGSEGIAFTVATKAALELIDAQDAIYAYKHGVAMMNDYE